MLLVLILGIVANAIVAAVIGLTAFDKPKGLERNVLLGITGVLLADLAAFLTIYATSYGVPH